MIEITSLPIVPESIITNITKKDSYGAIVSFVGIVRGYSEGKRVHYLEYEAYKDMAEKKMREIANEIKNRWQVEDLALCHRIGRLSVGETALVVVVAASHRQEAFESCQYAVERLKKIVPIWKKEVRDDGEKWAGGEP